MTGLALAMLLGVDVTSSFTVPDGMMFKVHPYQGRIEISVKGAISCVDAKGRVLTREKDGDAAMLDCMEAVLRSVAGQRGGG